MSYSWRSHHDAPLTRDNASKLLLEYFYPIHFSIGMKVEESFRTCGTLNRNQTVIMWLLFSETRRTGRPTIARKTVASLMTSWYDISTSGVSKALQHLSKPPLEFILLEKDEQSRREVVISLTKAGTEHCEKMVDSAASVVDKLAGGMTIEEAKMAVYMLMRMDQEFGKSSALV